MTTSKRRILKLAALALLLLCAMMLIPGCLPGASGGGPANGTYVGVIAGYDDNGSLSGSIRLTLKDGKLTATMGLPTGTVQMSGSLNGSVSGDGWTAKGSVSGSSLNGSLSGPNNAKASFSAENDDGGTVTLYCGTYSGDASGIWNFAVSGSGSLTGVFSGDADGRLSGTLKGGTVSLSWSGSDLLGNVSGQATGTASSGSVSGSWSGSGNSGTFASDQSCAGVTVDGGGPPGEAGPPMADGGTLMDGGT